MSRDRPRADGPASFRPAVSHAIPLPSRVGLSADAGQIRTEALDSAAVRLASFCIPEHLDNGFTVIDTPTAGRSLEIA